MSFAQGESEIRCEGEIITVTLVGSFNGQGAKLWTETLKAAIDEFNGKRFSIVMNNKRKSGHTPKAFEISEQFNDWLCKQNMVAKAVVKPSSIAVKIDIRYIPSLKRQNIKFFDEEHEAVEWITASMKAHS